MHQEHLHNQLPISFSKQRCEQVVTAANKPFRNLIASDLNLITSQVREIKLGQNGPTYSSEWDVMNQTVHLFLLFIPLFTYGTGPGTIYCFVFLLGLCVLEQVLPPYPSEPFSQEAVGCWDLVYKLPHCPRFGISFCATSRSEPNLKTPHLKMFKYVSVWEFWKVPSS